MVYLGIVYEREMTADQAWRVFRVKMWEMGHSFAEIDQMNMNDIGDILAYWSEKDRAQAAMDKERADLR